MVDEEVVLNDSLSLTEQIIEAYQKKDAKLANEIVEVNPNADIAEAMEEIEDIAVFLYFFRTVDDEDAATVFAFLSAEKQESILKVFSDKDLIDLLNNSFADDVVDAMEDLPANIANRILRVAPKDLRTDINRLLNYKDNTAGSVMTTEYIEMRDTLTVKEAIAEIRKNGREAETIYTIFVKDSRRTMVGTVDLDDLIFASDDTMELADIMNRDFVTCYASDDQEEVANMFQRYDLNVMAVVNKENKILGIITIDDAVDILVEEATEDIAHLGNVSSMDQPYLKTPIMSIVKKCLPWIMALMVLQVFSTMILSGFQDEIAKFALLSVFTPLIMDAGGNSGGQTTTLIIRSIALDEFEKGDAKRVLWKEFRVAAVIGGFVAIFAYMWLMIEMSVGIVNVPSDALEGLKITNPWAVKLLIAALVASTLFITMVFSRMFGCSLPFFAKALKKDPAVMCGPLTTTCVDIISLLSYFILWTQIFAPILGIA